MSHQFSRLSTHTRTYTHIPHKTQARNPAFKSCGNPRTDPRSHALSSEVKSPPKWGASCGLWGAWQAKPPPRPLPLALCSASSDSPAFPGPPCNGARRGTGGQAGASEAGAGRRPPTQVPGTGPRGGGAGWDQAGSVSGSGNCISGSAGAPGPGLHKARRADLVGTGLGVCGLLLTREVSPAQL